MSLLYRNHLLLMPLLYYQFMIHFTSGHSSCMEAVLYKWKYHLSSSLTYLLLSSVWQLYPIPTLCISDLYYKFLLHYTAGHTRCMEAVLYKWQSHLSSSINYLPLSSMSLLYRNHLLLMPRLYYKFPLHYTAGHTRYMEVVLYKLQYHLSSSINYLLLSSVWLLYHNLRLLMVWLYYKFPPHYTADHTSCMEAASYKWQYHLS